MQLPHGTNSSFISENPNYFDCPQFVTLIFQLHELAILFGCALPTRAWIDFLGSRLSDSGTCLVSSPTFDNCYFILSGF